MHTAVGDESGQMTTRAMRLLGAFLAIGGVLLLVRSYLAYQDVGSSDLVQSLDRKLRSMQFQLGGLHDLATAALDARQNSKTPRERLQRLYDIEERYLKTCDGLVHSVDEMGSKGMLRFLFQPDDIAPHRLTELRDWLASEQTEEHPLLSQDSGVDRKLRALAPHLAVYRDCLQVTQLYPARLRADINACMVAKQVGLEPLP